MNRSEAREQAFILVFEQCFREEPLPELLEAAATARGLEADPFMQRLAGGTMEHLAELDRTLGRYCVGWRLDRLPRVSLALLRLACFELLFCPDIPVGVSIDQAVELAKKYAGEEDAAYINGVLGSVARQEKPVKA